MVLTQPKGVWQLLQGSRFWRLTTCREIGQTVLDEGVIPSSRAEDALHISLATVHGMDFLLTWNFRHINNAEMKARIRTIIEAAGYESPVICSPEELGGGEP